MLAEGGRNDGRGDVAEPSRVTLTCLLTPEVGGAGLGGLLFLLGPEGGLSSVSARSECAKLPFCPVSCRSSGRDSRCVL